MTVAAAANCSSDQARLKSRYYTEDFKRRVVARVTELNRPGAISEAAREFGIRSQIAGKWVRKHHVDDAGVNSSRPSTRLEDKRGLSTIAAHSEPSPRSERILVGPAGLSERLIRSMLHERAQVMFRRLGLVAAQEIPDLAGFAGVAEDICAAASDNFVLGPAAVTIVVASPLIGYSRARIEWLHHDFITDIILAVAFARWAGHPCVIYLRTGEAMIGASRPYTHRWRQFGDQAEHFIRLLVDEIAPPRPEVTVIRTDRPEVYAHLIDATDRHHTSLGRRGDRLTRIRPPGGPRTGADTIGLNDLAVVEYLPQVLGALLDRASTPSVIAADCLRHAPAVVRARDITRHSDHHVTHLAHVPAPSLAGDRRMSTASSEHTLRLGDDPATNHRKVQRMTPLAHTYWTGLWHLHATIVTDRPGPDIDNMVAHYARLLTQTAIRTDHSAARPASDAAPTNTGRTATRNPDPRPAAGRPDHRPSVPLESDTRSPADPDRAPVTSPWPLRIDMRGDGAQVRPPGPDVRCRNADGAAHTC